jgi:hypothetical protein
MKRLPQIAFWSLILFGCMVAEDGHGQARHLRVVALQDDIAPGYPQTQNYSTFSAPTINNTGDVAFAATTGAGQGLWKSSGGTISPIGLSGAQPPQTSGDVQFGQFFETHINNAGEVTFSSYLAGNDVNGLSELGIWTTAGGSLRKVVLQGDPIPGSSPSQPVCFSCSNPFPSLANGELFCSYNFMNNPLFNDTGSVVFKSQLSSVTPDMAGNPFPPLEDYREAIWINRNGVTTKIVEVGQVMPDGAGAITSFNEFLIHMGKLNDNGDFAFTTFTQNGGGSWLVRHDAPGTFERIVAPNAPIDHVLPGATIAGGGLDGLNNNQQVLFQAAISGPGVTNLDNNSLWVKDNGGLHLVAREGDIVPGTSFRLGRTTSPNTSFISSALGGDGTAAFAAATNSGNGIFTADTEGNLKLIAHGGMQAPGLATGVVFENALGNGGNIAINQNGQVAFFANVAGPGISGSGRSVWVTDRIGDLHLVAMDFQQIEYQPGEFRSLGTFSIGGGVRSGNQDGDVIALNDLGEVVFYSEWGVFVSTIGTIPEPTSAALILVGLCVGLRRRVC